MEKLTRDVLFDRGFAKGYYRLKNSCDMIESVDQVAREIIDLLKIIQYPEAFHVLIDEISYDEYIILYYQDGNGGKVKQIDIPKIQEKYRDNIITDILLTTEEK